MNKFADIDEIRHAHSILLKDKPFFESDKIKIIECNESQDIKACPGSGKTTTLLAKLIILANRMPFHNNQGICVLTHTNVSIEEIKSKLGNKADILFKYPNHFGTIQSFVDKFLAIPYYSLIWNRRVKRIDNEIANHQIQKAYSYKQYAEKKCIYPQIIDRLPKYIPKGKKTAIIDLLQIEFIKNIYVRFDIDLNPIFFRNYGDVKPFSKNTNSDTYKLLKDTRYITIEKGTLNYNDAYSLAIDYAQKCPELANAFSFRFRYLFIDEMQDTDKQQLDIIDKLFDRKKTIVQRFGDHHQAIYNKINPEELWTPENSMSINSSKRFGENISKILRTVCIEDNHTLTGNKEIDSLNPILIVFESPEDVLSKFCELLKTKMIGDKTIWDIAIEENKKDPAKRKNIKAVGWVGESMNETREENSLTIKSYFGAFKKLVSKKGKVNYNSLKSFLRKQDKAKVKDYTDNIIEALLHILSIASIKNLKGKTKRDFTKTTLIEEYATKSEQELIHFRSEMVRWAKEIDNSEAFDDTVIAEIKVYIKTKFCALFSVDITNKYINQFIDDEESNTITKEEIKKNNIFEEDGLQVEVGTIHSVKGETHIATLYLETSYHGKHESERILEQMKGVAYSPSKKKKDTYMKETLKMAYVGMSRPRYMLCFAIHKSRFDEALNIENGGMWEVVNI